jgi:hypothetical protein
VLSKRTKQLYFNPFHRVFDYQRGVSTLRFRRGRKIRQQIVRAPQAILGLEKHARMVYNEAANP